MTWADIGWKWGSPEAKRWSWEGPKWTNPEDEYENCTITVQMIASLTDTVASTGWKRFLPGRHHLKRARFRILVNRPSSDFDVRIKRMTVRMTRALREPHNHLAVEVFS